MRLEGVEAGYGANRVVSGVDLDLRAGSILALVGPNGAGKTTLLRVIAGLQPLAAGRLVWTGATASGVGYVPQVGRIDPHCPVTVREFLELAGVGPGLFSRRPSDASRFRRVIDAAACASLLDRSLHQLSGGETQRVLIAFALLRDPDILLMDEPQTGLDAASSDSLGETLIRLARDPDRPRALVLVSHDLHFVARVADRVACLRGHLCGVGPTREMLEQHLGLASLRQDSPVP